MIAQSFCENKDWRYTNAILMALSQIGEYFSEKELDELKPILRIAISKLLEPWRSVCARNLCCRLIRTMRKTKPVDSRLSSSSESSGASMHVETAEHGAQNS